MAHALASHPFRRFAASHRGLLVALAAVFAAVLANAVWVYTQRRGQPLDIDEAGYAAISFTDYLGLRTGGLSGWWHQIVEQPVQAPLAPALASVLDWATGPRVLNTFTVSVLAYGVLLMATLGLTSEWSPLGRATAVFFVAASPVLLNLSRSFNFAELAAACLAGALYFGHASRCFTRTVPSLAWGAFLGLMLLSRTMTVAFLPGMVLAALVPVLARRSWSGLLRVFAGILLGAAVAATWYGHNFAGVYDYLTSHGYGSQAAQYGPVRSVLSPHDWYLFMLNITDGYLFAGEALFLLIGWVACAMAVVWKGIQARSLGVRRLFGQVCTWASADPVELSSAIVAVTGLTALMSSRNQGSAFIAPLVVPLAIVAARGIMVMLRPLSLRRPVRAGAVLTAMIVPLAFTLISAGLTFLPLSSEATASVSVSFPIASELVLWDSRGTLRNYEDAAKVPKSVEPDLGSTANGRAWLAAWTFADDEIWQASQAGSRPPLAAFAFNNRMLNLNQIALDSLIRHQSVIRLGLINPLPAGAPTAAYLDQMSAIDPMVTVVATVTQGPDDIQPAVPVAIGYAYASSLHFDPFARYRLPDGQRLVLWAPPSATSILRSRCLRLMKEPQGSMQAAGDEVNPRVEAYNTLLATGGGQLCQVAHVHA